MFYVQYGEDGQLTKVESGPFDGMSGSLSEDDPGLLQWLAQREELNRRRAKLQSSDLEMIRVLEDLVDVLVGRGVIRYTDLPEPAQRKLEARAQTRAQLSNLGGLLGADDEPKLLF